MRPLFVGVVLGAVLLAAGCGSGGRSCVVTPAGAKLCGGDAKTWCAQFGDHLDTTTRKACAAAEGRVLRSVVNVYFCTDLTCPETGYATDAQVRAVENTLRASALVRSIRFISKEQAFKEMQRKHPDIAHGVPSNPLPDALLVTADYGKGAAVAALLSPTPQGVERVLYANR